jgi:hypothetical protein
MSSRALIKNAAEDAAPIIRSQKYNKLKHPQTLPQS